DGNWFKLFLSINKQKKIVFFHTILEKLHIYKKMDIVKNIYDEYIVLTEGAKKELLDIGMSKNKIKKIYNIIPIDDILIRAEEKFEKKDDYFVMIGRIVNDSKDYLTVIEAFASSEIKEKLYIIGDGPYRKQLEAKIKEFNLESKVRLLGSKRNPYPILKNSKGLILSSKYEGLSNVILEALVLEKPVIATNCPYGPKEIIGEEKNIGILFTTGAKNELIDILKNFDFKEFNMLKMKSRIKDFSEENILKEIIDSLIKREKC
ncbi:MAG: glycosyltransferase, partial [Cetobacterium sp.]